VEQPADLFGRQVQRRRDDVRGPLLGELNDVLTQVGLDGPDARRLERTVKLHLFSDHRLALDHAADVVFSGDIDDHPVGFFGRFRPEYGGTAGRDVPLELDQQFIEIGDRVAFNIAGLFAPVLPIRNRAGNHAILVGRAHRRFARGLRPGRLVESLVLLFQERGPFEMEVFTIH